MVYCSCIPAAIETALPDYLTLKAVLYMYMPTAVQLVQLVPLCAFGHNTSHICNIINAQNMRRIPQVRIPHPWPFLLQFPFSSNLSVPSPSSSSPLPNPLSSPPHPLPFPSSHLVWLPCTSQQWMEGCSILPALLSSHAPAQMNWSCSALSAKRK